MNARRSSPASLYWRAMRRVERRAATYVRTYREDAACGVCIRTDLALLNEAVRLANRLAWEV